MKRHDPADCSACADREQSRVDPSSVGVERHEPPPSTNRRVLLKSSGLALFGLGAGAGFLDRLAAAQGAGASGDRVLVVVFLRGAMDGLMAVQPLGDEDLAQARPNLLLGTRGEGALIDLGNGFGLHPALAPVLPMWDAGHLAIVHGCGSPNPTRSHFDAQDYMETAAPGHKGVSDGWLDRLARRNGSNGLFGAVSITGRPPRSLQGPADSLIIQDLARFRMGTTARNRKLLESLYRESDDGLFRSRGRDLFDALRLLDEEELTRYRADRAGRYPGSALGRSLMQLAFLVRMGVGMRIGFAESTGWDTHVRQGSSTGNFASRISDLAHSLRAFWTDLGDQAHRVTVVTMTEFGRTVAQNGTGGTDHGHGSCLFVLSTMANGGILGTLPQLHRDALFEGRDLPVTTDFRAVLADVSDKVFGVRDDPFLFPGWRGSPLPVLWG